MEFCLVRRAVGAITVDGPDDDRDPERQVVHGNVTFTPMMKKGETIQYAGADGPVSIIPKPIEVRISDGIIMHRGGEGVKLYAGGPGSNPETIRWKATFSNMQSGGWAFTLAPVVFDAIPGGEIDLTLVAPLGDPAKPIIRGPQGNSLDDIIVDGSELVVTVRTDAGVQELTRIPLEDVVRAEADAAAVVAADAVRQEVSDDADRAKNAASTAQNIATSLPATISTEIDTQLPGKLDPELDERVPPKVAEAIAADRAVADAAAAAAAGAVDQAIEDNIGATTSQLGSTNAADANRVLRTNADGRVWISTESITQPGHPTNVFFVKSAITEAITPVTDSLKTKWLGTENLDTIVKKGSYSQYYLGNATTGRNYPVSKPGILQVDTNRDQVIQEYTDMHLTLFSYRRYGVPDANGALVWRPWKRTGWGGPDLGTRDLDTVTTEGYYPQPEATFATTARHYPVGEIGVLEVFLNGTRVIQRYTRTINDVATWQRYAYTDSTTDALVWRPWSILSTGQFEPSPQPTPTNDLEIVVNTDYTGATDAQPAIEAAIEQAITTNKPVRLKPGVLRITKPIKIKDGLVLRGSGAGKTIIRPQGQCNGMDMVRDESTLRNVVITDLQIDGVNQTMPDTGYTPTISKGIFLERIREMEMRNLVIRNTGATGLGIDHVTGVIENVWAINCGRLNNGARAGGSGIGIGVGWMDPDWEPLTIANCHTEGNGRYGIFIEAQSHNVFPSGITITGCTAKGNLDGIGDDGSTGTIITGCHVTENRRAGIDIGEGTMPEAHPGVYSKVIGNHVENNGFVGILATANADGYLHGVQIMNNTVIGGVGGALSGTSGAGDGIKIQVKTTDPALRNLAVKVSGNEIHGNSGYGIYLDGTAATVPVAMDQFWIDGNRIWDNGKSAIRVQATTNNLVISGNHTWDYRSTPAQTDALLVDRAHTGLRVTDTNLWFTGKVTVPAGV